MLEINYGAIPLLCFQKSALEVCKILKQENNNIITQYRVFKQKYLIYFI